MPQPSYTDFEISIIRELHAKGVPVRLMTKKISRSQQSIYSKLAQLGLTPRKVYSPRFAKNRVSSKLSLRPAPEVEEVLEPPPPSGPSIPRLFSWEQPGDRRGW